MFSIVLITDKKSKEKVIEIFTNDKEIAIRFSPRMYFTEILERVKDNLQERISFWSKQYQIEIGKKIRRRRPSGLKYNCDPDKLRIKSEWMKKNNPAHYSWNEQRKQKLSQRMKGNRFASKPKPEHWKQWMSEWMKQYACTKNYKWVYNSALDKETRIPPGAPLPEGYRYGRNVEIINAWLNRDYWY